MRTSVIHDLIENFVDETELFFDIILSDFPLAIGLADEDERVKKLDGHGSVDVGLGGGQKDEILVRHRDVRHSIEVQNRVVPVLLRGDDLRAVVQNLSASDVVLEGSVDENLTFDIYEDHRTYHF